MNVPVLFFVAVDDHAIDIRFGVTEFLKKLSYYPTNERSSEVFYIKSSKHPSPVIKAALCIISSASGIYQ